MYPLDKIDTEPIGIDEFRKSAQDDIDRFTKNMGNLRDLADKRMSQFEWYMTFGYWSEYLNYFDELNKKMEQ